MYFTHFQVHEFQSAQEELKSKLKETTFHEEELQVEVNELKSELLKLEAVAAEKDKSRLTALESEEKLRNELDNR